LENNDEQPHLPRNIGGQIASAPEFGHVHCLDHAYPVDKKMRPSIAIEEIFRTLHTEDINGGLDVIESSESQLSGSCPGAIKQEVMAGCLTNVANEADKFLRGFEIYPNPFGTFINISFNLPNSASVEVCLIDLLGRRLTCLDFKEHPAGHHIKTFDLSSTENLPTGMYILRLKIDDSAISQKLIKF
jgi:hypothetical protein